MTIGALTLGDDALGRQGDLIPTNLFDPAIFDGPTLFATGETVGSPAVRLFQPGLFSGPALFDTGAIVLAANTASFALTGQAISFARGFLLTAQSATFTLTANDVGLIYSTTGLYNMPAIPAAFTFNGIRASLRYSAPEGWTNVIPPASTWTNAGANVSIWTNQ
jgi:hypothetical protein